MLRALKCLVVQSSIWYIWVPFITYSSSLCLNCSAGGIVFLPELPFLSYVGLSEIFIQNKLLYLPITSTHLSYYFPWDYKVSSESSDFLLWHSSKYLKMSLFLYWFFSNLNILSSYKYFFFACQLLIWCVILHRIVYRCHVIIKYPFKVPFSS